MFGKRIYIWLAFAVKVEVKEEASRWGCPLNIYGSILPQRGKKSQKSDIFNLKMSLLLFVLGKGAIFPSTLFPAQGCTPPYVLAPCICAVPTCGHVYVRAHRARMYAPSRARSNRNVVFLLSQVSHQGQKAKSKQPKFWRRRQYKTALLQVLSTEFWALKRVIC